MELRPYQRAAIDALFAWWEIDKRQGENPLIVAPTGAGKTIIFATLIQEILTRWRGTRILVLAKNIELVEQAESKLCAVWPAAPVGVYCAGAGRREIDQVTIASRDSIVGALDDAGAFDLVFIDEAHGVAPGENTRYRKIIADLKRANPSLHVIGFTATPFRTGQGYIYGDDDRHLFAGVAYEIKIRQLIADGYLAPVTAKAVESGVIDTDGIRTTAGDFNRKELDDRASDLDVVAAAVREWYRLAYSAGRRATLFFCVSVAHAELVSWTVWKEFGIRVPVVTGETPKAEREDILTAFAAGRLAGVANVAVLTEGFDAPVTDCVTLLRPTKSLGLYLQMVGRGLRLAPKKENCLVLDFGECIDRFGPIDTAQPAKRSKSEKRSKTCPECSEVVSFFARKCPACGFEFQARPVKICDECGAENAPSAARCIGCDHVFARHGRRATNGGILSTETRIESFEITEMSATAEKSKRGNVYLRVRYASGLFQSFYRNLMIGMDGYAGRKAIGEWASMTVPGTPVPPTANAAALAIRRDPSILRPVERIFVDMADKYRTIERVQYANK